ncbi:hypothetical protein [Xanthobacter autotrophicus]|uniref:hypothetical protein n=1 Tax=Xanthobacter autotrophicus TaxID=280 RepID=UPI0037262299
MTVIDRFGRPKDVPANYILQEGETSYIPMAELHNPARTRCMGDAALATFFRDGGMGGGKADAVPAGFFKDAYGRVLPTGVTSGNDRADGKALGARLAYEADLRDGWKAGDDAPAAPAASLPDAKTAYDAYIADITNAHRLPDPALP